MSAERMVGARMPAMTVNEIRDRITNGSIIAISVDTTVFDEYGCNLKFSILDKFTIVQDNSAHHTVQRKFGFDIQTT